METLIIDEKLKKKWDEFVYANPFTIAYHSYDWNKVLKKHYKADYFPIAAYDGSEIRGILPLYHTKTTFSKDILISVPHSVAGGIIADTDPVREMLLEKAIEISKQYDMCNIILKQYRTKIDGDLKTDDNFYNRELTLSKNIDEVWKELSDVNREKIKEAENIKLILEYPSPDINKFYKLLLGHPLTKGVPCVSKKWIENIIASKMYSIAFLKLDGDIVAGTMVKTFKQTVSFPFTSIIATDERNMLFIYRLYWELIQIFSSEGYGIFHSGRIPEDDSTYSYRLGWGGTKYRYYYQYYPNTSSETEYSIKRGKKRAIFESCWKLLPSNIARLLGPHIVKQFP